MTQFFLKIYPNPANELVNLRLLKTQMITSVDFYDLLGIKLSVAYSISDNTAIMNVRTLTNGTYITMVTCTNSGIASTYTLPLIVQH